LPIRPDSRVDWPVKRRCPCGKVFFAFSSLRLWCSKSCESWHGHPPKTPLVPLKVTPSGTVGASVSPCNALRGTNPAGYPPLCLKRSGARSAGLAKCPQVACQKNRPGARRMTPGRCVPGSVAAGWVRLHASPAASPGGAPRDLLTGVHALPCYPHHPSKTHAGPRFLGRSSRVAKDPAGGHSRADAIPARCPGCGFRATRPVAPRIVRRTQEPRASRGSLVGRGIELALVDCACPSR